jgi:acyl-coenzyme A thioesterase PaaI-like protein
VTGKEFIEVIEKHFSSEERMRKYRYGLIDLSGVEAIDVSTGEVEMLVDMNKHAEGIIHDGVVVHVAPTDVAFGMARMWQAMMEKVNWETHVSRSRDDAVA